MKNEIFYTHPPLYKCEQIFCKQVPNCIFLLVVTILGTDGKLGHVVEIRRRGYLIPPICPNNSHASW